MQRLSSTLTFFYKRVIPSLYFGFLTIGVIGGIVQMGNEESSFMMLLIPLGMMLIGYLSFKVLVFDLFDEVYLDEKVIVVRNRGDEDRIPLSNIAGLYSSRMNPAHITLILHQPCKFGCNVSFSPTYRWLRFSAHPIETELRNFLQEQEWQKRYHSTQTK